MSVEDEVRDLRELLHMEDLVPGLALTAFDRFGTEAREAVTAEVARQFDPPPPARVLARLLSIATEASKPVLTKVFLANLRSPDPKARLACLDGLVTLGYRQATDVALACLRDEDDGVVATAVRLLLPTAGQEPRTRDLLGAVYAARREDPAFHMTASLLDAHGITPRETS